MNLSLACGRGSLDEVTKIIHDKPYLVHHVGVAGWTPIFYAVRCNDVDIVKLLMKHGANPHICDSTGTSAYHIAVQKGYTDIVNFIENNGV